MKLVKTLEFTHASGCGQHFFFDVGNGRDAIAFFWFDDAPPPAPGIAQSGRWLPGAPRRSAIGAMDHVALDVPRDKIEAYRDKLRAKGIAVTEIVNHSDRPGIEQYLPAEPNEDTFLRSIYFQNPDGITLEFACWGRPLPRRTWCTSPRRLPTCTTSSKWKRCIEPRPRRKLLVWCRRPCRRVELVGWPGTRHPSAADGAGAPRRARCERSACAPGAIIIGPKVRTIARDARQNVPKLVDQLFAQGYNCGAHFGRDVSAWPQHLSAVGISGNSTCDGLA